MTGNKVGKRESCDGGGDDEALDVAVDDALELDHVLDEIPYGHAEQQMLLMLLELQLL